LYSVDYVAVNAPDSELSWCHRRTTSTILRCLRACAGSVTSRRNSARYVERGQLIGNIGLHRLGGQDVGVAVRDVTLFEYGDASPKALSSGTKRVFLKLHSDLDWAAPNYATSSESSCTVEGQIKCSWNDCGTHQYEASSKRGDVPHNAIGGASGPKYFGRFEHSCSMNTSSFLHVATIAAMN
jgi:hypothetical protein